MAYGYASRYATARRYSKYGRAKKYLYARGARKIRDRDGSRGGESSSAYGQAVARRAKANKPSVYRFTRSFNGAVLSATSTNFAFEYMLSQLPAYTEFTSLYDEYRIIGATLHFMSNVTNAPVGASAYIPRIWVANDLDANGPSTAVGFLERPDHVVKSFSRDFKYYCAYPRVAKEYYRSPTTSAYGAGGKGTWLDCAAPDVPHYGTYCLLEGVPAAWSGQVYCTLDVEFKGVR